MRTQKESNGCFHCQNCECEFSHNWRTWAIVGIPYGFFIGAMFFDILGFGNVPEIIVCALIVICLAVFFLAPESYVIKTPGKHEKGAMAPASVFFKIMNSIYGRLVLFLVPAGTFLSLVCLVKLFMACLSWRIGWDDQHWWDFRRQLYSREVLMSFLATTPGYIALFLKRKYREKK
jgi:hypothetical protein